MSLAKHIATYAALLYLGIGIAFGSLIYATIPAVNVLGWGWYALTWPSFVCHGTKVCAGSPYVPDWSFTFKVAGQ